MKLRKSEAAALVLTAAVVLGCAGWSAAAGGLGGDVSVEVLPGVSQSRSAEEPATAATAAPATAAEGPVDINRAGAEELMTLKGVGEVLAGRIIDWRERNGPFRTPADLTRVKGIGPKLVEQNLERIRTEPEP